MGNNMNLIAQSIGGIIPVLALFGIFRWLMKKAGAKQTTRLNGIALTLSWAGSTVLYAYGSKDGGETLEFTSGFYIYGVSVAIIALLYLLFRRSH